jgi:hypothetical protein
MLRDQLLAEVLYLIFGVATSHLYFHATVLGFTFGSVDTIFTATGLLVVLGALYAMVNLRIVYGPSVLTEPKNHAKEF